MSSRTDKLDIIRGIKTDFHTEMGARGVDLSGKVFGDWPAEIQNIGGGAVVEDWRVRFIDWDGTVLKEEVVSSGQSVDPPIDPVHSGYIFQGWNFPNTDIQQPTDIQAVYTTDPQGGPSSPTVLKIYVDALTGMSPTIHLSKSGAGTLSVNWDVFGTPVVEDRTDVGNFTVTHTYTTPGEYWVAITPSGFDTGVTYSFGHGAGATSFLGSVQTNREMLQYLHVGEFVETISDYAFYLHAGLKYVTIPNGVLSIGINAFGFCHGLANISIPDTVSSIGDNTFDQCFLLETITVSADLGARSFLNCRGLLVATLAEGITSVGVNAFENCYALRDIVFPGSLTFLGSYVLAGCRSFDRVITSSVSNYMLGSGIVNAKNVFIRDECTELGQRAFFGCSSLEKIRLPESAGVTLGSGTCYLAHGVKAVKIPGSWSEIPGDFLIASKGFRILEIESGVGNIGNNAFSGCYSLQGVSMPESITAWGSYCFNECRGLKSVELSPNLTGTIPQNAFYRCYGLREVTIPEGVTGLAFNCFGDCKALLKMVIQRTAGVVTMSSTNVLAGTPGGLRIYVPDARVDEYKEATNWDTFQHRIYPMSALP